MARTTPGTRPAFPAIDRSGMFRRIATAAALAGLVSGLLLTAIQRVSIEPMIRDAELREEAAAATKQSAAQPADAHAHAAWEPANAAERLFATAAANIVIATGFALLVAAAMTLRGAEGWRAGAIYGLAGFAALFVAPSLGLPPELPGSAAAALDARQLWWAGTALATGAGLAIAAFCTSPLLRVLGVALLIAPHAIGAPHLAEPSSIHSAEAARRFVGSTYAANAVLWLVIGAMVGAWLKPRRSALASHG